MSDSAETTGATAERDLSRQLRGSSLLLVGRLLAKFANFGVQVAIVRLLSKGDFGVFAYGLALAQAGEVVVKFGLGRGANRFVPYHAERGEYPEVIGILALVCSAIVGLGAVGFVTLWWISGFGWSGIPAGEGARVVLILSILAPVQALDTIGIQTLACFSKPREILMRKHVLAPALRVAAVAVVFFAGGSSEMLALAYLAGGVLGLFICFRLAVQQLYAHGILPLPPGAWRVPWSPLARFSFPLISSDLVFITLTGVTTVVLMMTNGEEGVAEMRAVVPAAMLITLVVQSFSMLFLPGAMRLQARGDIGALREHHWRLVAWVAVLSFPLFGLTFGIAPGLVPVLLGEGYANSATLLAVLALGHYFGVCMAFNGETLQVFARTRAIVLTDCLTIVVAAGLALSLCPDYGAMGAAIAVTAARLAGSFARQLMMLQSPGFGGVPAAQKWLWAKLFLASLLVGAMGWIWQPPFVIQVVIVAGISLVLLRLTAPTLDLGRSFPELQRIPLFARVVGA